MQSPPTGTVTFLFTDIEGSTRLWEERPDEMRAALADHDGIVRSAVEAHGGYVFATGGDGFAAAFSRAGDAVDAAAKVQAGLAEHPLIRVRMGLHTGEVQERGGDYFGPAVNRAARIMSAGHGGQTVCSRATAEVLGFADLVDLGEHTLAGLSTPVQVFQLGSGTFPALRSVDTVVTNLPAERTVFVGRDRELAELEQLAASTRVITLSGVGGVGKTRLAIQVGAQLLGEFRDGVWLVELAPLIDQALVAAQVASSTGAPVRAGEETLGEVCRFLAHKRALVIFDNCEHVLDAVAGVVDRLIDAAPRVTMVATSREPLGVRGERVFRVPSLSVDAADGVVGDAVELFVRRAAQVRRGFVLDDANRDAVAQVCRRLDGIPLAIELAAARVGVLAVGQIAVRLDERFRLLTRGGRTAVPRQQTLQGAIDWSYELLSDIEREVFDAAAVFAGHFDLAAAAAVAGVDEFDALDVIQQLVDKSMIETDADAGRYRLLETLRQYGWDRLIERAQLDEARGRHAEHYAAFVAEQAALLRTPGQQVDALDRLDADYDNLRAALGYLIDSRHAHAAARLVRRLVGLFNIRHPSEGLGWFQSVIAIADELPPRARARLLGDAAHAALNAGDPRTLFAYAQQALEIGGTEAPAVAHNQLAHWHQCNNDPERTLEHGRRGLAAADDLITQIVARGYVVLSLGALGDEAETRAHVAALIEQTEALADPVFFAATFSSAGAALAMLGRTEEARAYYETALRYADGAGATIANVVMSSLAIELDDSERATALLRVAIPIAHNQLGGHAQTYPILASAKVASHHGRPREAARLLGAVERCFEQAGIKGEPYWQRWRDRLVEQLTATIDADTVAQQRAAGHRLSGEDALEFALDCLAPSG